MVTCTTIKRGFLFPCKIANDIFVEVDIKSVHQFNKDFEALKMPNDLCLTFKKNRIKLSLIYK